MNPAIDAAGVDDAALLRSVFFAYPDALLVVGPDGAIVRANPASTRLLGYAEQSSFTRAFRAAFGVAPSVWRASQAPQRQGTGLAAGIHPQQQMGPALP